MFSLFIYKLTADTITFDSDESLTLARSSESPTPKSTSNLTFKLSSLTHNNLGRSVKSNILLFVLPNNWRWVLTKTGELKCNFSEGNNIVDLSFLLKIVQLF